MGLALAAQLPDAQLPVYLTRFFGRERQRAEIEALLEDPEERVITLVGPGGVGKTRLLVEALHRYDASGMVVVDGAALDRAELLLPELVDLLGIDRSSGDPAGELLSEHLAGQPLLVVLDNMEHLLDAALELAGLVRALPKLRIVATSRAPLHISGERLVEVAPLPTLDGAAPSESATDAARLFVDRARHTGKLSEPTVSDLAVIEAICARLDGLPLAIELAAARLRVLSLPALLGVLTKQLTVLTGGPVDVSPRHRALRSAIRWSYDLLGADEQRLLRELGAFPESFSLPAVTGICTPARLETLELLETLFDEALLIRVEDDPDGQPRYRMLTSIREFAVELLEQSGDEPDVRARHAGWFLEMAERLEPALMGSDLQQTLEQLQRASPNLRQASQWFIDRGDQERALRLVEALYRYWSIRGLHAEARATIEAVFALGEPQPTVTWAAALRGAAIIAETQFDNDTALRWNAQAIAIWEALGERSWLARSRIDLGNVFNNLGRFDDAIDQFRLAAAGVDLDVDARTYAVAQGSIANSLIRKGELAEADRLYEAVLPSLRRLGDGWILSTCLANAALVQQRLGATAESRALLLESLELRRNLNDDYGTAVVLVNLCDPEEKPEQIETYARQALEIANRLDAHDVRAAARVNLSGVALGRGETGVAARLLIEALNEYAAIDDVSAQLEIMGLIAALDAPRDPRAAARLLGAVRSLQEQIGVHPTGPNAVRVGSVQLELRRTLGTQEMERQLEEGRGQSLAEARVDALDLAREAAARRTSPSATATKSTLPALTPRELDVLRLIVKGLTDREIAEALYITPKTANHHVTRILAKLECRNRAAATAIAYRLGLAQTE